MLRNIFPDGPPGDQDASQAADDPGAFFAEFLPSNVQVKGASPQKAAASTAAAAAKSSAADATASTAAKQAKAADASATAAAAASTAAQQQPGAADIDSSDFLPDLPSLSEIKAAATAWFGDDADAADSSSLLAGAAAQQQQPSTNGKSTAAAATKAASDTSSSEDSEGLLDRLLPSFGQEGGGLRQKAAGFRAGRRGGAKPKPLRLKLAEQVLSKELLSAVQVVESEILSSQDALPAATLKFFLKAGRNMGQGWVSENATRVFGFLTAYVAATCGVMHGVKAAAKCLAWRVPRLGKRVTGPAVSFSADVLLPTPFFGPCLATYVLIRLLCKPPKSAEEQEAEAAAAADADADVGAGGSSSSGPEKKKKQVQREVQVTRSRSRELQLELVVDEHPPNSLRGSGGQQWLQSRRPLGRTGSIRGRLRNRVGRRVSVSSGPSAVEGAVQVA